MAVVMTWTTNLRESCSPRSRSARRRARSIAIALALGGARRPVLRRHAGERAGGAEPAVVIDAGPMNAPRNAPQARDASWSPRAAACSLPAWSGAAYAAVPLYNWFCRTTGFGGTPQVASARPATCSTARSRSASMPTWPAGFPGGSSRSRLRSMSSIGEVVTVNYRVDQPIGARDRRAGILQCLAADGGSLFLARSTASASPSSGLRPARQRDMPVVFFVDPEIVKDAEQDGLDAITLSYTMYPVRQPQPPQSGPARACERVRLRRQT